MLFPFRKFLFFRYPFLFFLIILFISPLPSLSQEENVSILLPDNLEIAEGTEEDKNEEFIEEKNLEEEYKLDEIIFEQFHSPVLLPILFREYSKEVVISQDTDYFCHPDQFKIDVSKRNSGSARINFIKVADVPYEIEIGSLPLGFDIRFEQNNSYEYIPDLKLTEGSVNLSILVKEYSQKGDFTVPIIYTKKGLEDSSVICQINIVNL